MVIHTIHIEEKKAISGRIGSAGPPALGTPAPAPEKIFLKKSPASAYSCVARAPDLPRRGGAGPVRALRNLGRDCQILRRGSQHDLAVAVRTMLGVGEFSVTDLLGDCGRDAGLNSP